MIYIRLLHFSFIFCLPAFNFETGVSFFHDFFLLDADQFPWLCLRLVVEPAPDHFLQSIKSHKDFKVKKWQSDNLCAVLPEGMAHVTWSYNSWLGDNWMYDINPFAAISRHWRPPLFLPDSAIRH